MNNQIDHFTIGADNLQQGSKYIKEKLGVDIPSGSKHDAMSTHNCVTQGGNTSFLELISIDPEASAPGRTRWFTLDDARTQASLKQSPRPLCWVVNTDDLDAVVSNSPVDLGEVVFFQRGERTWRLTVPKDGNLPEGGLVPAFIEWSPGPHPSSGMQDQGICLSQIQLQHPDSRHIKKLLSDLGVSHLADVVDGDVPKLSFVLNSPMGVVQL